MTRLPRPVTVARGRRGRSGAAAGAVRRHDGGRRDRRRRLHRAVDRVLPPGRRPVATRRRGRGRDRRLRRVGAQRRMVLRAVPGRHRRTRWPRTGRRPRSRSTARWRVRSPRWLGSARLRTSTPISRWAEPSCWRARKHNSPGPVPSQPRRTSTGWSSTCSDAAAARARLNATERAGRDLHAALRRDPAGQTGARPRRRRRGPRRRDLRTHPCDRIKPRCGTHRAWHGACRRGGAGHRGLHRDARPPTARDRPGLLADHRHRAATGRRPGPRSVCTSARRSATSGTSSSTASAVPTAGWCSAAAARRTTSARGSVTSTTGCPPCSARSSTRWSSCSRSSRDAKITHRWGGPLGIARDWHASVGLNRATGLAWAGGYVGDGVSTTNLAGRTLADLIGGRDSDLTATALGRAPVA